MLAYRLGMSEANDQPQHAPAEEQPRGVRGKWVILALFVVSILGSTLMVLLVRPIPGGEAADPENRPFGPATTGEQHSAPLIYRSGDDE